jgi:hypothetical protein
MALGGSDRHERGVAFFAGTNRELALGISVHLLLHTVHRRRGSGRHLPFRDRAMDSIVDRGRSGRCSQLLLGSGAPDLAGPRGVLFTNQRFSET